MAKRDSQGFEAPHPGQLLREIYFEPRNLSVTEGAQALRIARKNLSQILNGHAAVSAEMALKLAELFDTSAEMWLLLQAQYDLALARSRAQKESKRSI